MAEVFLSHSSRDKAAARQLARDLKLIGHEVWLDEWKIKVGQCISTEIGRGIDEADFVVLLLSSHAVESKWVDVEWRAAHWDEVSSGAVTVLPVLLEECAIPKLLQTKKYADLTKSYGVGFRDLSNAIEWYCDARGLTTAYEPSTLELPRIIRGSEELKILTCIQLRAKALRMDGSLVVVQYGRVEQVPGPFQQYTRFALFDDSGSFDNCAVMQDTELEDVILERPTGDFFGTIRRFGASSGSAWFVVSEYEPSS